MLVSFDRVEFPQLDTSIFELFDSLHYLFSSNLLACKKLEKTTLRDPDMVRYINATFVPVHIDVDKQKRVAEILEVESLPCTIVLSPEADLLGRFEGFDKPAGLHKKLAAAKKLQGRVAAASGTDSR